MLTDWARRTFRFILEPIADLFQQAGFSPNLLTAIGLLLQINVALVLSFGHLAIGGVLLLVFSAFDALDGTLARLSGQVSRFGAFLDSTVDRYAEAFVLMGLLIHVSRPGHREQVLLIYASIVGSLLVSYTRAKAESLAVDCKVGLLTRVERVLLLAFGLLLNTWHPVRWLPDGLTTVLWLLAVFSNVTALQRIWAVWQATAPDRQNQRPGIS